jgi:hypothetical protein
MRERIRLIDVPPKPNAPCALPPVAHHLHLLPLETLSWEDFERLCVRLAKTDADAEHAQSYGIRGQSQEGIDLYVRRRTNGRYVVWQCKRYQTIEKAIVHKAVTTFLKSFKSKEAGIPVKDAEALILAVTADMSHVNVAKELERLAKRLRKLGLRLIAYDIQGLSDELKKHRALVEDFFNPAMADAFCGIKQPAITEDFGQIAALRTALQVAQEGLASYGNAELDQIRDLWGERREEDALAKLYEFKNSRVWHQLGAEVQAKALRIEAGLKLAMGDATRARELYEEAGRIAPQANARILEGKLLQHEKGTEAALEIFAAPTTQDEWVFRWTLLLELGCSEDVVKEAAALTKKRAPAGDYSAVLALAQLAQFEIDAARHTIHGALQEKPRHVSSRYVAAVVDYYSGISTAFRVWRHMIWPVPPAWNLVKRDVTSVERRNRAAQIFAELAQGPLQKDIAELRVWHLACVALNADSADQPSKLAQEYLAEDPKNVPLLVWASALGLNYDRSKSLAALKQKIEEGKGSLEDLLALLGLLDDVSDLSTFESLLTHHRQLFVDAGREPLWFLHQAQVLISQSKITEGIKLGDLMPASDESNHIRLVIRQLVAEQTKNGEDYRHLAKSQEDEYGRTKSPEILLACCRTHRLLQQWEFIAQHSEELVREIATQSALELAAESLLQVRRESDCLALLKGNRALCEGGDWTPFLRQLAAECHRLLGDLPAAISELKQAVVASESAAAKMQLFQTQVQKGDLPASLQTARLLSNDPNVPAEFLVENVIPIARHHDIELARDLILKVHVNAEKLAPNAEVKLMDEAARAGVESTFHTLVAKLTQQAASGDGPLKAFTYEQIRDMLIARQKKAGEIWTAYARGEIPVHCLSLGVNLPLAKLFHEAPRLSMEQRQPTLSATVFTRYANDGNSHPCLIPMDAPDLYLDVTSLLLLDALKLLPVLETAFERLHVGSSLVHCLEEHLDQLSAIQPDRLIARQKVVELLDRSQLRIWPTVESSLPSDSPLVPLITDMGIDWCHRLLHVQVESGLLIDFLPLHARGNVDRNIFLPDIFAKMVISAHQLIGAMKQYGWIPSPETDLGVNMNRRCPDVEPLILRERMLIHLDIGQAEELALAGVLPTLCEKAQVTIEEIEAKRLRQEASQSIGDARLKTEVQRLLAHLSNGIDKGKYRVYVSKPVKLANHEASVETWERALIEMIDFAGSRITPVCVDDRMIRSHSAIGNAPLCDSWDILHHLRDRGAISADAFHDLRSRMRAANLRYLPVSTEEIVSCVQRAPIHNGQLIETPELACLRRYVATTLLDHATLQGTVRDSTGRYHPREAIWPAKLQVSITKAITEVWQQADPASNHAGLHADWIWLNLYFDQRVLAELFGYKLPDYDPKDAMAQPIGSLFAFGLGLYESASSSAVVRDRRVRYFQWIEDRCIIPLLPNNPDLWKYVAGHVRRMYSFLAADIPKMRERKGKESVKAKVIRHLFAAFVTDLPPELVGALALGSAELEALGLVSNSPGVEVLGVPFPAAAFWDAIARVLRQKHATVWTSDHKTKLRLKFDAKSNRLLVSPAGVINKGWSELNVPFLQLLSNNQYQREAALRAEAAIFDWDEPRLSEIIAEISACSSAAERISKRTACREQSVVARHIELIRDLREKKSVNIGDLFPDQIDCIRRYLRLELEDKSLEDIATRLIQSVGWIEAMVRMSRLPSQLPVSLLNYWKQLCVTEQESYLRDLESNLASPIERMRLFELLCHPATCVAEKLTKAQTQLSWLLDEKNGQAHGRAMLTVVRWVHLRLGWHAEASKWPAFVRLCAAWSYGCTLHQAFQTTNASPDSIKKWFANNSLELFSDSFYLGDGIAHDAANPISLRFCTLYLKGIAVACGRLDDDQINSLGVQQQLPEMINKQAFVEHLDLWADRSLGENLLGSYLANVADDNLRRVVGDVTFNERIRLQPRPVVEQALSELLKNPHDVNNAALLSVIVGDRPMHEEFRKTIPPILSKIDLIRAFKTSPNECSRLVLLASQVAASSCDVAVVGKVWEELLRLVEHMALNAPQSESQNNLQQGLALSVVDAAIRAATSSEGRLDGLNKLTDKLCEVARRWPAFSKFCGPALGQALSRVPVDKYTGNLRVMLTVRSRA